MDRRSLIKSCAQAVFGIGGMIIGAKAATRPVDVARTQPGEVLRVFITPGSGEAFQNAVVKAVVDDVRRNGPTRDVIINTVSR